MSHQNCSCNESIQTSRREMIKAGAAAATWGLFGLSLPRMLFLQEAYGIAPDPTTKKYDAVIQCFMTGGPSQTDTWDPKADPNPSGYQSPVEVFPTLSLGSNDIYGKPIWLTNNLTNLANLVNTDPTNYGLGIIRSMHHGNGVHAIAESFMNCYWQSPVGNLYASTSAAFTYLMQDQVTPPNGVGLPTCVILNNQGAMANTSKGSTCPTALQVTGGNTTPTVQMLTVPVTTGGQPDTARYNRRAQIMDAIEQNFDATRPDNSVKAWTAAWKNAQNITLEGKAAAAFNLTGVTTLPGGPTAHAADLQNLTLAQQLVLNGIPFVSVAIGGNDTHLNNRAGVTMNWGDTVDVAVTQMAKNLKASGKRVLVTFFGDFGRTPFTTAPKTVNVDGSQGQARDGRDHWPSGFSAAMLSIGQPAFKTNAVGDTGPDGMWTATSTTPLKDIVYPGALGGMVYRAMGYSPTNPNYYVPNALGSMAPPVDPQYQDNSPGNALWLAQNFGIL
ncbi:MAG TPA: DUF1501 domain-containing protein [Planctomycetota bacterium]|nr:DUF1501 domain-containing protein [Planctomycetota bacterium]